MSGLFLRLWWHATRREGLWRHPLVAASTLWLTAYIVACLLLMRVLGEGLEDG